MRNAIKKRGVNYDWKMKVSRDSFQPINVLLWFILDTCLEKRKLYRLYVSSPNFYYNKPPNLRLLFFYAFCFFNIYFH